MKQMPNWAAALGLAVLLAGCAEVPRSTEILLTYETDPVGAQLFEGDKALGMAPVMRKYPSDGKTEVTTPDVTAVWPSGAKTSFFTILPPGADRVATLKRPAGAPGLQADLDHAKTVAATAQREADRMKANQLNDMARMSDRCQAQMSGKAAGSLDNCQ